MRFFIDTIYKLTLIMIKMKKTLLLFSMLAFSNFVTAQTDSWNADPDQNPKQKKEAEVIEMIKDGGVNLMKIDQIPFDLISKHNENIRVLIVTNSPDLTSIPAKINTLKNLKKFYISGTQVKDLPEDLFKIDGLESFEYNMNQTEKIPSAIGNLTSLKKLNLSLLPIQLYQLK